MLVVPEDFFHILHPKLLMLEIRLLKWKGSYINSKTCLGHNNYERLTSSIQKIDKIFFGIET